MLIKILLKKIWNYDTFHRNIFSPNICYIVSLSKTRWPRPGDVVSNDSEIIRYGLKSRAIQAVINTQRADYARSERESSGRSSPRNANSFATASVGITAFAIWANGSAHEWVSRISPSSPSSAFMCDRRRARNSPFCRHSSYLLLCPLSFIPLSFCKKERLRAVYTRISISTNQKSRYLMSHGIYVIVTRSILVNYKQMLNLHKVSCIK